MFVAPPRQASGQPLRKSRRSGSCLDKLRLEEGSCRWSGGGCCGRTKTPFLKSDVCAGDRLKRSSDKLTYGLESSGRVAISRMSWPKFKSAFRKTISFSLGDNVAFCRWYLIMSTFTSFGKRALASLEISVVSCADKSRISLADLRSRFGKSMNAFISWTLVDLTSSCFKLSATLAF